MSAVETSIPRRTPRQRKARELATTLQSRTPRLRVPEGGPSPAPRGARRSVRRPGWRRTRYLRDAARPAGVRVRALSSTSPDALPDRPPRALERHAVVKQDERRVCGDKQRLQFESELGRIDVGGQLAELLCLLGLLLEQFEPLPLLSGDRIVHGTTSSANLGRGRGEEAATRKDLAFDVGEERIARGEQATDAARAPIRAGSLRRRR